jgi:uncharacterized membrane protein
MTETNLLNVTLYTRENSKPGEDIKKQLKGLEGKYPHRLVQVNIDSDPTLKKTYGENVPVVEIGPYILKSPITKQALQMTLAAAGDRRGQLEQVGGKAYQERLKKGQTLSRSDGIYFWISRHYMALLNILMFLYVGLPFAAPTLMKLGATVPARVIYTMYSPLCHQFGFRSFFLFGEQPYYPLKVAGIAGLKTFDQVTGFTDLGNPYSISRLYAREYLGNPVVGYKVAFCERDVAIYAAILFFGLLYSFTGRKLTTLHWGLWILIGILPMGIDGFWQLFSQFNWPWLVAYLPYHESTPFQRELTGFLFGFATAWFAYPSIEESMRETRQIFIKKFAAARPS